MVREDYDKHLHIEDIQESKVKHRCNLTFNLLNLKTQVMWHSTMLPEPFIVIDVKKIKYYLLVIYLSGVYFSKSIKDLEMFNFCATLCSSDSSASRSNRSSQQFFIKSFEKKRYAHAAITGTVKNIKTPCTPLENWPIENGFQLTIHQLAP